MYYKIDIIKYNSQCCVIRTNVLNLFDFLSTMCLFIILKYLVPRLYIIYRVPISMHKGYFYFSKVAPPPSWPDPRKYVSRYGLDGNE